MRNWHSLVKLIVTAVFTFVFLNSFNALPSKKIAKNLQMAKLPIPMMMPHMVQAKGKFYVISQGNCEGFRKTFNIANLALGTDSQVIVYEFIPASGILKKIADTKFVRCFFGACAIGNKLYIAGGYDSNWNPTATLFEYDLNTKKWTQKNSMFFTRSRFVLECVAEKLYAIGGESTNGSIEVYNPKTDLWELANTKYIPSNLNPLLAIAASAVIDDKIYLLGTSGSSFQVFNPSEGILAEGPKSPAKSDYYSAVVYNKRLYIAGGLVESAIDDHVYLYDKSEGIWSSVGKIPVPRYGSGLAYYSGMLMYLGGSTVDFSKPAEPKDDIYIYRPMK